MKSETRTVVTFVIALTVFGGVVAQDTRAPASQIPGEQNYEAWLEFIRPSEQELAYEKIGWRNKFWPAVEEARKLGRPILLWTMNGHPLACT